MTEAQLITALGPNNWADEFRRLVRQGYAVEHYSTCALANGMIAHSAIFVRD